MADIITEIVQITTIESWFVGYDGDSIDEVEPIAFFAVVKSFDAEFPSLGFSTKIVPVTGNAVDDFKVGKELRDSYKEIVDISKLSPLDV